MGWAWAPLLLCSLLAYGAEGFFPGAAMSGSQQLEAYKGFSCQVRFRSFLSRLTKTCPEMLTNS